MADVVKSPLDVSIHYPLACACALGKLVDPCHSIMAPSTRSEAIARSLEACFPFRLQCVFDHALPAAVKNGWNAEGPQFSVGLGNVHPSHRPGTPDRLADHRRHQLPPSGGCFDKDLVHAGRVLALILLRRSPHTEDEIGPTPQHQLLKGTHLIQVVLPRGPKDPLSQVPNQPVGLTPVNGVPIGWPCWSV